MLLLNISIFRKEELSDIEISAILFLKPSLRNNSANLELYILLFRSLRLENKSQKAP